MKDKKQIAEKLMNLETQGCDEELPGVKEVQAQANILAWVLDKEEVFEIK